MAKKINNNEIQMERKEGKKKKEGEALQTRAERGRAWSRDPAFPWVETHPLPPVYRGTSTNPENLVESMESQNWSLCSETWGS